MSKYLTKIKSNEVINSSNYNPASISNCIGLYDFTTTSALGTDTSGLSRTGTNNSIASAAAISDGTKTRTLTADFSGGSKSLTLNSYASNYQLTNFSMSFWVRTPAAGNDVNFLVIDDGTTTNYLQFRSAATNKFQLFLRIGGIDIIDASTNNSYADNLWTHIVFFVGSTTGNRIYINGVNQALTYTTGATGTTTAISFTPTRIMIGGTPSGFTGSSFTGYMDTIAFYSKRVTDGEITALYTETQQNSSAVSTDRTILRAGTVINPSLTFEGSLNSGLYAIGTNNIGLSINSTNIWNITSSNTTLSQPLVISPSTLERALRVSVPGDQAQIASFRRGGSAAQAGGLGYVSFTEVNDAEHARIGTYVISGGNPCFFASVYHTSNAAIYSRLAIGQNGAGIGIPTTSMSLSPSLTWQLNDSGLGFQRESSTSFSCRTSGTARLTINDTNLTSSVPIINSDSTATTSLTTGSVRLSGGIAINNTTDASSITNGGTFSTGGGAAIGKKLYVGTQLFLPTGTSSTPSINYNNSTTSDTYAVFYSNSNNLTNWTASTVTPLNTNDWRSICYSEELNLYVAVAATTTTSSISTSPDGLTWTTRTAPNTNQLYSVIWIKELSLFVASAITGSGNRIITSPNGTTWTARTTPADNQWVNLAWSPELGIIVAISNTGTNNRAMYSYDAINWTIAVTPTDSDWRGVTWASELGLFVAVGNTTGTNRVMTSPDGITWSLQTAAEASDWTSICWAPELGLLVAVASAGTNRIYYSSNATSWTAATGINSTWQSVIWAAELGLFIAAATTGTNIIMTSPDGINWTGRTTITAAWTALCWSKELYRIVTIGNSTTNRAMYSDNKNNVNNSSALTTEIYSNTSKTINNSNTIETQRVLSKKISTNYSITFNDNINRGGVCFSVKTVSDTSYTMLSTDYMVEFSAENTVNVTLPLASLHVGRQYNIIKTGTSAAGDVIIGITGSDKIDNNFTSLSLLNQYDRATLISNGAGRWYTI